MAFSVTPVILTCEADLALTAQFVTSFRSVRAVLNAPVVLLDLSCAATLSDEYLRLLASLEPTALYTHPAEANMSQYDSVQEAANLALEMALRESAPHDYILFMEDDILFSSRFPEKVVNTYLGPETGFFTMYLPGDGYGSDRLDPNAFYGTQCLLFTRKAVEQIKNDREEMMTRFWPGYDIRWSRLLADKGYVLYASDCSYVQHLPGTSRLHGQSSHRSNRFVP